MDKLDLYLSCFYMEVKRKDGSDYEPDTLVAYQRSFDRHLKDSGRQYSIIKDIAFTQSRNVLAAKRKDLKQMGKGNRINASEPITAEEEDILYEKGILGLSCPEAVLNTVWYNNTKLLGFRGNNENRKLTWGDITLKSDVTTGEYLEFNERDTKTRDGTNGQKRAFAPKQFELTENPSRCPVRTYKIYKEQRPSKMTTPDSPFYLRVNYNRTSCSSWYSSQPLGVNTLGNMVKSMCSKAGITGRKTNHSVRKTTCSRLLNSGIHPTKVMQLTGHKNITSLNNYSSAGIQEQRSMSRALQLQAPQQLAQATRQQQSSQSHTQSQFQSQNQFSSSTQCHSLGSVFGNAIIHGGVFNISINQVNKRKSSEIDE